MANIREPKYQSFFPSHGEQISESPVTPAFAEHSEQKGTQKETWQPTHIYQGMIGISGGLNKRALAAATIEIKIGSTTHRFVELQTSVEWFLNGVGGAGTQTGDVKAVTVLQDLRDAFLKFDDAAAAVADIADNDEPDPMDALDAVVIPKPMKSLRATTIRTLQMPTKPLCAGASEATTNVVVYSKNACRFPQHFTMFLKVECIDWLLSYAAGQLHFQGVDNFHADEVLHANCAAVAGLHVEWNFHLKEWQAQFVSGPFQGVKRKFGIESLNPCIWAHLEVEVNFQKATRGQQKAVAKRMLLLWCQAICDTESVIFEQKWDIQGKRHNSWQHHSWAHHLRR